MRSVCSLTVAAALSLSFAAGCGAEAPSPPMNMDTGPTRPAGVALCYSKLADDHPATLAFWTALRAGDREARAAAITDLTDAVKANPQEEELALLLGLAHLWRVAEPRGSEAGDQSVIVTSALAAKSNLETALQLCPTDYRINAWLGPIDVRMGRTINDQSTIDQGLAVLQQGIDHYPSFVLFSKVLVYAQQPASDPDFQKALDAVNANVDSCGAASRDPACGNEPHAAHNMEGAAVFAGDAFAKAARRDEALKFYQSGKTSAAYASWKWQSLLDDRLSGLDARIAAYQSGDPAKAPDEAWTSGYQCAICHVQ